MGRLTLDKATNIGLLVASVLMTVVLGLNGGVGYVLLSWDWYFTGSPTSNGHLNQQYDCDDI